LVAALAVTLFTFASLFFDPHDFLLKAAQEFTILLQSTIDKKLRLVIRSAMGGPDRLGMHLMVEQSPFHSLIHEKANGRRKEQAL